MTKDSNIGYRLQQAEKKIDALDKCIDSLMSNHIPHLREDIISLKTRVNVTTAINVGAMIVGIIASKVL